MTHPGNNTYTHSRGTLPHTVGGLHTHRRGASHTQEEGNTHTQEGDSHTHRNRVGVEEEVGVGNKTLKEPCR